jgi:small redox-active disulfide protein 2
MSDNKKKGLLQSVFGGKKSDCCNVKIEEIAEEPEKEAASCCGAQPENPGKGDAMDIKILGVGCPRCVELEKHVIDALAELGNAANVEHITELKKFAAMGVFMTPGLVVNGKVVAQGKVPSKDELKKLLAAGKQPPR